MKTSEKIYINPEVNNYNSESPFTGSVEYVRSDIAKEFASFYLHKMLGTSLNGVDELFAEFLNSRNK